jgi:acyl-CoA thioesterase
MEIQYLAPGRPGQRLVAEAVEEDLTRRTALYRITIREESAERPIAVLHARVYRMDRPVLPSSVEEGR